MLMVIVCFKSFNQLLIFHKGVVLKGLAKAGVGSIVFFEIVFMVVPHPGDVILEAMAGF